MAASARDLESDADLVRALQSGATDAFDELYRRHYEAVRRACARKLGNVFDADEVAQATFVRALERIDQCKGPRRFGPWVQVIAQRLCIDTLRARARVQPEETPVSVELVGSGAIGPEESVMHDALAQELQQALERLPRRQREAVVARTVHGRRPGEIAAALGLSIGAVDSLLLRAKRSLAAFYHRVGGEGGAIDPLTNASAAATLGGGVVAGPRRIADGVTSAAQHLQQTGAQLASTVGIAPGTRPPLTGLGTAVLTATLAVSGAAAGSGGPGAASSWPAGQPAAVVGRPLPGTTGTFAGTGPGSGMSGAVAASLEPLLVRIAAAVQGVVPVPAAQGSGAASATWATPGTPAAPAAPSASTAAGSPTPSAASAGPLATVSVPGLVPGLLPPPSGSVSSATAARAVPNTNFSGPPSSSLPPNGPSPLPASPAPTGTSTSTTPLPGPAPAVTPPAPVPDVLAPLAATIAGVTAIPPATPLPPLPALAVGPLPVQAASAPPPTQPPTPTGGPLPLAGEAAANVAPTVGGAAETVASAPAAAAPPAGAVGQVPAALPAALPAPSGNPLVPVTVAAAPVTDAAGQATNDVGSAANSVLGTASGLLP